MSKLRPLPCAIAACLLTHCAVAVPPPASTERPSAAPARSAKFTLDTLRSKDGGNNNVFLQYNPGGSVRWNPDWPGQVDLTGVAWDSPRTATAITPRHVVMAAHYPRKTGDTLVFHDRSGTRHARTLVKTVSLRAKPTSTDITVGLLNQPLPGTVKTYPLLEPGTDYADRLAGGPVLITDQTRHLYVHEVWFVSKKTLKFVSNPSVDASLRKNLIKGDSGNPAFLILEGGPVLVETHSSGGPGAGPFYSATSNFKAVKNAVRDLDPNYRIKTRSLDADYTRLATERRAERKTYLSMNSDGSSKKPPKPRVIPTPKTSPGSNASPPSQGTPTRKDPRVRRVPTAKSP